MTASIEADFASRPAAPAARALYEPPRPKPLPAVAALLRAALRGGGDLLSLLPAHAYRSPIGWLGYSRRGILVINDPALLRQIMTDPLDVFPKNDLMVGALQPLVGDSMFVCSGETWRRQRRMLDPAFSQMRIGKAFSAMSAAVDAYEARLAEAAECGAPLSLDLAMSHLTADVICRTVFSTSLQSEIAREVFEDFSYFERTVAHVQIWRLIAAPAFAPTPHQDAVLEACARIRTRLGQLLDQHDADAADIAAAVIGAEDPESGARFSREELIDQLGVFFLAGHETTASALTWAFFILSIRPEIRARIRAEVATVAGDGAVGFEHAKRLAYTRGVFKEALRLYPPLTFIPRVARAATEIGGYRVRRGAMIMISPWTLHRNAAYWPEPHAFDPERFTPEREKAQTPGSYIPFGHGPRICIGAGFATLESVLILARLARAFDFEPLAPESVRPVARLTTRPKDQIMIRVHRRAAAL